MKKWKEFIKEEFVSGNRLDGKMQELKDLVEDSSDGHNILYEWENKNDHQLLISFTINDTSIKYEFDIDDLILTKTSNNSIEFTENVESEDEGLDIIEKDIYKIIGVSEELDTKEDFIHSVDANGKIKWVEDTKQLDRLNIKLKELNDIKNVLLSPKPTNKNDDISRLYSQFKKMDDVEKDNYHKRLLTKIKNVEDSIKRLDKKTNEKVKHKITFNMKHLKYFLEKSVVSVSSSSPSEVKVKELLSELYYNKKWVEVKNTKDIYYNSTIHCYEYELRLEYKIMILVRKIGVDHIIASCHLKDEKRDEFNYLDNIFTPYFRGFLRDEYNKYTNFCIRIGENQMEYYNELDKMIDEYDLRSDLLTEFTDDDNTIERIEYGYVSLSKIKKDNYSEDPANDVTITRTDLSVYHKDNKYRDFRCVICLNIRSEYYDEVSYIEDKISDIKSKLGYFGNYTFDFAYNVNGYSLIILIGNK